MIERLTFIAWLLVVAAVGVTPAGADEWRTVTDASGVSVRVPAQPQRVVALSEPDLDAALALGLRPVATLKGRGQDGAPRYLGKRAEGIEIIGNFMQPSLGRLIELQPDLILAGGLADSRLVARLRAIAPTVVTQAMGDPWKAAFRNVAQALNRVRRYDAFMAEYRARIDRLRAQLADTGAATVSIVRWNPRGPAFMLRDAFSSRVVRDLGLRRPPAQREPGAAHSPPLSLEALQLLDGDWMFVGTLRGGGQAVQAMARVRALPAFAALTAAGKDHVVVVDGSLWTSAAGPLAAMAILDDVARAMVRD